MSFLLKHKFNLTNAIGEIILIFVGITLAIAFNNWNEERKLIKQGKTFTESIYEDLNRDVRVLQDHVVFFGAQLKSTREALEVYESPEREISDSLSFINNIVISTNSILADRALSTWDELQSSGRTEMLHNDVLVNKLQVYYLKYDSRIANFHGLPQEVRLEAKMLMGIDNDLETMDSFWLNNNQSMPSKKYYQSISKNRKVKSILYSVLISSHVNLNGFNEQLNEAQSVMNYMQENMKE